MTQQRTLPIAELVDGQWISTIPARANYFRSEARQLLGLGERRIQALVKDGVFEGPESTEKRPIDHGRLVAYARVRRWQVMRLRIRRELREAIVARFDS